MPTIKTYYIEGCSEFNEDTKSIVIRTKDIKQVTRSNGLLTVYYDKVNTSHHRQQSEQGIITLKGDSASELFGTEFVEFELRGNFKSKLQLDEITCREIDSLLRATTGVNAGYSMIQHVIEKFKLGTSEEVGVYVKAIMEEYKIKEKIDY